MHPENRKNNQNDYLKLIEESIKKKERKSKFSAIGKLGGRPKKLNKKVHKYSISLNDKQNDFAKDICEKNQITLQEFLRRKIENEPLPNPERNKFMVQTISNFNRISNFFDSKIWMENERHEFKILLKNTCTEILKSIKK